MRSGDRPGLQNRRMAGNPVIGGFDPHSLPPFVFIDLHRLCARICVRSPNLKTGSVSPQRRRRERTSTGDSRQGLRLAQGDMRIWRRGSARKVPLRQVAAVLHGKQFRQPRNTRSFGTAEEKARELERRLNSGEAVVPANPDQPKKATVADKIATHILAKQSEGLSNSTAEN